MKKPTIYVNEFDPNAAAWIRELMKMKVLPEGEVDERSITDVQPNDLRGFTQCHFFAGIGGWLQALILGRIPWDLRLATASLPCQPWSASGLGLGEEDDRHLYPTFHNLVVACQWPLIFGEQVASAAVVGPVHRPDRLPVRGEEPPVWYSGIRDSLESASYTVGALDLPAPSIGTDCEVGLVRGDSFAWEPGRIGPNHIRQRLYWCAWLADARRLLHERGLRPLEALRAVGAAEGKRLQRQWSWDDFGRRGDVSGASDARGPQRQGGQVAESEGDPRHRGGVFVPTYDGAHDGGLPNADDQQCQGCRGEGRGESEPPDHRGLEHCERPGLEGHRGNVRDRCQSGRVDPDEARPTAEAGGNGDIRNSDSGGTRSQEHADGESGLRAVEGRDARRATDTHRIVDDRRGSHASDEGREFAEFVCQQRDLRELLDTDGRHACEERQQRGGQHGLVTADCNLGFWLNSALIPCTDGKARRIESGTFPLAHGIPRGVLPSGDPGDEEYAKATGEARTTRLRGYGNAIMPQLASEFIQTCVEVIAE